MQKKIVDAAREIEELEKGKNDIQAISLFQSNLYKVEKQIEKVIKEIEELEKEKQNIQNIQIIQPPVTNEILKSKTKIKHRVMLATAVGVFLSVFLAFFLEYISKFKDRNRKGR